MPSERITLPRTGDSALRFTGRMVTSARSMGEGASRWHQLVLYRGAEKAMGLWVVAISYRTTWESELGHDLAQAYATDEDVREALKLYDPVCYLVGFPPGEQFAVKQNRLIQSLRAGYRAAVSELLEAAGIVEEL